MAKKKKLTSTKVTGKKKAIKKDAKRKAPKPKYAGEKEYFDLLEAIKKLTASVIADRENSEFEREKLKSLYELVGGLARDANMVKMNLAVVIKNVYENLSHIYGQLSRIRQEISKSRLVPRVTIKSPNGTTTTEEPFSSKKEEQADK